MVIVKKSAMFPSLPQITWEEESGLHCVTQYRYDGYFTLIYCLCLILPWLVRIVSYGPT